MNNSPRSERLLFLGANTPWVYALAESLAICGQAVAAIATYDSRNFQRLRPRWPTPDQPVGLHREIWVSPPGYVGALAALFAPFLRSRIARARAHMGAGTRAKGQDWIVAPYPWFARTLRPLPGGQLIYYNLDDYVLYHPARSKVILRQESEMIERAALTLCLSRQQVETLGARFPKQADRIRHFPLGVVDDLLNLEPARPSEARVVGYIGNLIDRVDWRFVQDVAGRLPDVEFHFIGSRENPDGQGSTAPWQRERDSALAMPNVRHIGPVPQGEVGKYYWSFSVNWMPYKTSHAFNQASCPTKIMDGLASGRPLVSTDVPECRLYPHWISIASTADEAADLILRRLETASGTAAREDSARQVEFVREKHTWASRAELLQSWLAEQSR